MTKFPYLRTFGNTKFLSKYLILKSYPKLEEKYLEWINTLLKIHNNYVQH